MKNLKEVFNPRITNPHKDHSIVFYMDKNYFALNIFYLKTETNVG